MKKLAEFFQDPEGGLSATRLAFLLWIVGVLVVWIVSCFHEKKMTSIDSTILTLIGILMGGKAVQRFGEQPADVPSDVVFPSDPIRFPK